MANITPGEARIGWGVFLAANGSISKEDLQNEVDQLGVGIISDRMYRHYRALYAAGYDHYIPINRFDILQSAEPFGNESANSRYKYADLGAAVRVTVVRDSPFTFLAVAARVSDAGVTLTVEESSIGAALSKGRQRLRPGDFLRIDFIEGPKPSVDGRLVDKPEAHPRAQSWLLDVEFNRLRSVVEFTDGTAMPVDTCPVRLAARDGGPVAADVLGRRLYHLLDAIENTRSLFNDVADHQTVGFTERVFPVRISHVQMESPLEVTILVPVGVVSVLGIAYSILKGGPVAFKTVQDGRLSGAQARRERALAESTELDNDLKRLLIRDAIRRHLASSGAELTAEADPSRLFRNTLDQLMTNLDGLGQESVTGLELPAAADPGDDVLEQPSAQEEGPPIE
jgi:hypothetical protein